MNVLFHRHKYHIIGTGNVAGFIQVDLVCKCGKCGGVYVPKMFERKVYELAINQQYFKLPKYAVLTEGEYENLLRIIGSELLE